jgi:hypothetical protein
LLKNPHSERRETGRALGQKPWTRAVCKCLNLLAGKRPLSGYLKGENEISDELVFPSLGTVLDPDN